MPQVGSSDDQNIRVWDRGGKSRKAMLLPNDAANQASFHQPRIGTGITDSPPKVKDGF